MEERWRGAHASGCFSKRENPTEPTRTGCGGSSPPPACTRLHADYSGLCLLIPPGAPAGLSQVIIERNAPQDQDLVVSVELEEFVLVPAAGDS